MSTVAPASALAAAPERPPPNSTAHGVNNSTFHTLWSGDVDTNVANTSNPMAELAASTDVPLDSPPKAVERWNRGDHTEFPATNESTSYHPPDADLSNRTIIKDAAIDLFAVQPSTRATLSPDSQPHYVAPTGSVLATVDYRIDDPTPGDAISWSGQIESVDLYVDGRHKASTTGIHTPTLDYGDLASTANGNHTFTVEATIVAQPRADCTANGSGNCASTPQASAERLIVRDSIDVVEYDLEVSGYRTQYPDGDVGLLVFKNKPWLGYRFPQGDVRGVWRFYSARDPDWDTLVRHTESNTSTRPSPLRPLQVYAYPIETGPTPSPRGTVSITTALGSERDPPTLPKHVNLDILSTPYTASYRLITHIDHPPDQAFALQEVEALGLVRGVTADPGPDEFRDYELNQSRLTLSVQHRTAETVTVRAHLRDADTDAPIVTEHRDGYLVIADKRVNTTANGTVTVTLPRQDGAVAARYEAESWWLTADGYVGDTDSVYVGGTIIHFLRNLYRIAVPVSTFLGAVFIIDRFAGWSLWPPWRRL